MMNLNENCLKNFKDLIAQNQKFLISSHQSLDTDAVTSEYVLHRCLEILDKDVITINEKAHSSQIEPFPLASPSFFSMDDQNIPADCNERVFIVVDSDPIRTGQVWKHISTCIKQSFIIDHHEYTEFPSSCLILPEAGSCCEIISFLIRTLGVEPDEKMAEALYSGIVTDTGFFSYPKTSSATLKEASFLVERGVDSNKIFKQFYQQFPLSSFFLRQDILKKIEFHCQNRVALLSWNTRKLSRHNVCQEDLQDIVNIPLSYKEIELSILFKQKEDRSITCSLRSKGLIDCSKLAQNWQGGGHKTAAGFRSTLSISSLRKNMLRFLKNVF